MNGQGKSHGRQSNESALKLKILEWIDRLSTHFGSPQEEEQIKIFLHALRNCTAYQVDEAFERCLNECQFMPKLADVHMRMPEQKYAPENPGRFVLSGPPILDLVRAIAIEMYPNYETIQDGKEIETIFVAANRERYRRMGIDPDKWQGRH